jgi:putative hydrolase of the HAD superfamily
MQGGTRDPSRLIRVREIDAVIFDFGDTLFERAGGHRAVVRAARGLGVELSEPEALRLWQLVQARARTAEELARGRDLSLEAHRTCWTDLYRAADVIAPGMAERLYGYEVDPGSWQPFPEAAEVMLGLRQAGVPVGVVSDTGWDIRAVFEHHGLAELVDVFVLSCESGVAKPDAGLFDEACRELGVPVRRTLMVGDNPLTDGGAVAAGLPLLVIPPPASRPPRVLDAVSALAGGNPSTARFRAVLFDGIGTLVADPEDTPYPDTLAVLQHLKTRGVRIGVLSERRFDLRPGSGHHALAEFVGSYFPSPEHEGQKSDTASALRALEALAVGPHEAIMAADRLDRAGAAAQIGMPSLVLPAIPIGTSRGLAMLTRLCG